MHLTVLSGLGSLIGCVINFFIGDILGRRKMIWLAMGLIIVGATLQTSASSLAHLITGRIITGFGTGIDSSTVPMYQSELSRKEWRGRIVSWEIWFIGKYLHARDVAVARLIMNRCWHCNGMYVSSASFGSPLGCLIISKRLD